jgi:hypothetical protein
MQKLWTFIKCFSFVQAHVEDIKKSHLRDLLSNEERSRSMLVYVTYFMNLYSLTIWYFIFFICSINLGKYNFEVLKIFSVHKIEPNSALAVSCNNLLNLNFAFFEVNLTEFYWTTQGSRPPLKQGKNSSNWLR